MALKTGLIRLLAEVQFESGKKTYDYLISDRDTEKVLASLWSNSEYIKDEGENLAFFT